MNVTRDTKTTVKTVEITQAYEIEINIQIVTHLIGSRFPRHKTFLPCQFVSLHITEIPLYTSDINVFCTKVCTQSPCCPCKVKL